MSADNRMVSFHVVHPCVTVRGVAGSQGVFYADHTVTTWPTADGGEDYATLTQLDRLIKLGAVLPLAADPPLDDDATATTHATQPVRPRKATVPSQAEPAPSSTRSAVIG